VGELAAVDPQREPAQVVGLGHDHALGPPGRDDQVRADHVGVVVDPRDHPRHDVLDIAPVLHRDRVRYGRQDPEEGGQGGEQGEHLVLLRLGPEQLLQLGDLAGVIGGQVACLGEIIRQVVQLGRVGVGVPHPGRVRPQRIGRDHPRDPRRPDGQPPAVLVHGPVAHGLEVLLGAVFRRGRVGQRVREGHPVEGLLLDPVDLGGGRDPGDVQDRRADVDGVGELRAQRAAPGDPGLASG